VRGNQGVWVYEGPPSNVVSNAFTRDATKMARVSAFSGDGKLFSWCNGDKITVVAVPSFEKVVEIDSPKTMCMAFSPLGTYLATWEPFAAVKDGKGEQPNLQIWNVKTGESVKGFVQKKQMHWNPEWSADETLCARIVGGEIFFHENNNFDSVTKKFNQQKVTDFSLAGGRPPHHFGCYVAGTKGQPSFIRVYCYPRIEGLQSAIANKSFFKGDKVDFMWNKKGTGLLLLTGTEVDKTGASYYGVQNLHYVGTNGDSCIVQTTKEGPVYNVQWSPTCTEFCVIFGFMPAKVALYNLKCEITYDFGTGPRNCCYYSPRGDMLLLAGFGNLRGPAEVWDVKSKQMISSTQMDDTTYLSWCPDNEHILTATTAPRLRVGNGFKIWHYTGSLIHGEPFGENAELWEVLWQPVAPSAFPEKKLTYTPVVGVKPSQPAASKEVYRPPQARGRASNFKLHEYEAPKAPRNPYAVIGLSEEQTQPQQNRKKKEPKKGQANDAKGRAANNPREGESKAQDKDKQIKNLKKKLGQIEKLKEDQQAGKQLDNDQIEKMKREELIRKQIQELEL
jgi:translation initiation factor 2A